MTRRSATTDALVARSPAQPLFLWRAARRLTVLAYHRVDDPVGFERQLDVLCRWWSPVDLEAVLAAVDGRAPGLPRRAVMITFDDGDPSVLSEGLPRLAARGIPAVAFVVAGLLDGEEPPWWQRVEDAYSRGGSLLRGDESESPPRRDAAAAIGWLKRLPDVARRKSIADLEASASGAPLAIPQLRSTDLVQLERGGIEVGNHTFTHPCLPRCGDESLEEEIALAHHHLAAALGHPPRAFAYPNGDYDRRAERMIRRLEYRAAFLFDHRVSAAPPREPLRISRVRVSCGISLDRFRLLVSGLHPALHHALGRP